MGDELEDELVFALEEDDEVLAKLVLAILGQPEVLGVAVGEPGEIGNRERDADV